MVKRTSELVTCVGCDLQGLTEVSIASCCSGPNMENIGSQRIQTLDIRVPGSCADNPIASVILILHYEGRWQNKSSTHFRRKVKEAKPLYSEVEREWRLINSLSPIFSSVLAVLLLLFRCWKKCRVLFWSLLTPSIFRSSFIIFLKRTLDDAWWLFSLHDHQFKRNN